MATVVIITKIMPESPTVNLEEIKKESKHLMEKHDAKNISFEERPIAFGLKAIIMKIGMPEEKGTEVVENTLSSIKNVSSVTIEDYRRAFG